MPENLLCLAQNLSKTKTNHLSDSISKKKFGRTRRSFPNSFGLLRKKVEGISISLS